MMGCRRQDIFFDVRVYNPHAPSNWPWPVTPNTCYQKHKRQKRKACEQWLHEVEHGTFPPLVFSSTGGMGPTAVVVFKWLAGMIAERSNQRYSTTMRMVRCQISFLLLRSATMCLRGSQSSFHRPIGPSELPADVVAHGGTVAIAFLQLTPSYS